MKLLKLYFIEGLKITIESFFVEFQKNFFGGFEKPPKSYAKSILRAFQKLF